MKGKGERGKEVKAAMHRRTPEAPPRREKGKEGKRERSESGDASPHSKGSAVKGKRERVELAISIQGLAKSYGDVRALRGIDLRIERAEIFGFLGPNGSGKTTTIRCILDLIRPTSGSIRVFSVDPQADPESVRGRCGYLPGELHFDDNLTAGRVFRLLDSLRGARTDWTYVDALCRRLDLDTTKTIKNLSKGNKQKVGVIQAFMHKPDLLLLDEPTAGLDPIMQQEVLKLAGQARDAGATVFFSSHILSEVQAAADRIAVVREGRIVEVAPTQQLLARPVRSVTVVFAEPCPPATLSAIPGVRVSQSNANLRYRLQVQGDMDALVKAIAVYHVKEIQVEQASLEDVFLAHYRTEG